MANEKKYLGIRFPFTSKDSESFFVDMDYDPYKEIKSDLTHLLFTPKGQRVRNPNFGTNMLKYIFEPNDDKTMTDIKIELQEVINKYFPGLKLLEINIDRDEEAAKDITVDIKYEIDEGIYKTLDNIKIKL